MYDVTFPNCILIMTTGVWHIRICEFFRFIVIFLFIPYRTKIMHLMQMKLSIEIISQYNKKEVVSLLREHIAHTIS